MPRDLAVIAFLTIICISRYLTGDPYLIFLIYLAVFSYGAYYKRQRLHDRREFINQLKSHRHELRQGGTVVVNHSLLRYGSEITTYHLAVGGIFSCELIPSRYHVAGEDNGEPITYSLLSFITGWWAFPYGPIVTASSIYRNIRGGERQTVAELIDGPLIRRAANRRHLVMQLFREEKGRKDQESRPAPELIDTGPGSRSAFELIGAAKLERFAEEPSRFEVAPDDTRSPGEIYIADARVKVLAKVSRIKGLFRARRELATRQRQYSASERRSEHLDAVRKRRESVNLSVQTGGAGRTGPPEFRP